jgi:hypothetical protein
VRLQFRRGTEAQWTSANPTLAQGEMGVAVDTGRFKVGDGFTEWNNLMYGGFLGPTGPQGTSGIQGIRGLQGIDGFTGPQGIQGAQGLQGNPGPTGATGAPSSVTGPTGPASGGGSGAGLPVFVTSDASNNRLGINTTAPTTALDVSGTITVRGNVDVTNNALSGVQTITFTRAVAGTDPFPLGGGTATVYNDASGNAWAAHAFSSAGTFTFSNAAAITGVRLLVVGGGGGGGGNYGGGGGAGGLTTATGLTLPSGTLSLTVGAGGAGAAAGGANGSNSTVTISGTAYTGQGGGAGGSYNQPLTGSNGGCGGGGGQSTGGSGTQGFGGGTGGSGNGGAGGGGMGGAGANSGNALGGVGVANNITGTSIFYSGGGAGGSINNSVALTGGAGGGGNGGSAPTAGTNGLGGGGGGGVGVSGANGGSGAVILAYPLLQFGSTVTPYGTVGIDASANIALTPVTNVVVNGPTNVLGKFYGRLPVTELSGTSTTLASSNYNTYFYLTNSGFNALTLPSSTAIADGGSFWTLRNATTSSLSMTLTNTLSLTSPLVIPPANSQTLVVSSITSNTILLM